MLTMIPSNDSKIFEELRQQSTRSIPLSEFNLLTNRINSSIIQDQNQSTLDMNRNYWPKPTMKNQSSSMTPSPMKNKTAKTQYSSSMIQDNYSQINQLPSQCFDQNININNAGGESSKLSPLKVQPIHVIFDNNNESVPKIVLTPSPSSSSSSSSSSPQSLTSISNQPIAVSSSMINHSSYPVHNNNNNNNSGMVHLKYNKKQPTTNKQMMTEIPTNNYRIIELPPSSSASTETLAKFCTIRSLPMHTSSIAQQQQSMKLSKHTMIMQQQLPTTSSANIVVDQPITKTPGLMPPPPNIPPSKPKRRRLVKMPRSPFKTVTTLPSIVQSTIPSIGCELLQSPSQKIVRIGGPNTVIHHQQQHHPLSSLLKVENNNAQNDNITLYRMQKQTASTPSPPPFSSMVNMISQPSSLPPPQHQPHQQHRIEPEQ